MKRRTFIAGLGTAAWPVVVRAQQAAMPVIGYLGIGNPLSAADNVPLSAADNVAAFREGLSQAGYIEGRNLAIEFRFTRASPEQLRINLQELAADLVRRQVAVIVAEGGPASVRAAMAATSTIPRLRQRCRSDQVRLCLSSQSAQQQCYWDDFCYRKA